ncbi:helix-turn-helix domain-containing protein [Flavobacterium sp. FlaQc-57]|uniref:helix-turn-helix domain-containing protein n=1 Tax=Flavobacterium sp. FlaQc-57 TaxID=3374186 RepID=UPI00375825C5
MKWDWLHFVPALLHFIEFIPFYLMPTQEKIEYLRYAFSHVEILSKQQEGFLPANFHPFLKTFTGIVYEFFQSLILFSVYKKERIWVRKNKVVWNWLVRLTFFHSLTYLFVFASYVLFFSKVDMRVYSVLPLGFTQFFCTINLIFNPRILYGMKEIKDEVLVSESTELPIMINRKVLSFVKTQNYKKTLDRYLEHEKPYLQKKYSIRDLSADCNIPVHYLSIVINDQYGCNYSDFINRYRIQFIIENRYSEFGRSLSLEGLASEAGFNSKNSFYTAFKKNVGCTPSEYFARQIE